MIINDVYEIIKRDKELRMKIIYVELDLQIATVQKVIKKLKNLGFITVEKKERVNFIRITGGIATEYDLLGKKAQAEYKAHSLILNMLKGKSMTARQIADKTGRYQAVVMHMTRKLVKMGKLKDLDAGFRKVKGVQHRISKYTTIIN